MTLAEKVKELFGDNIQDKYIGIDNGTRPIYTDFMDEYLETHGNEEIEDYIYSEKQKALVVKLKNKEVK